MVEPFELTVAQAVTAIRDRTISAVELMDSLLARASALEPRLHVWVTLDPELAMEAAARSQHELNHIGPRGPLHGVPVGVKDIFYTKGMKTTAGSPIYADFVPDYDATSVALLKCAGAIVMGKTVTTEFACNDPPPTLSPWNPAHTPGGSSTGSAVGTASRIFPAALGSQTAGSILRPASYNGVVGLKPSLGRISRHGVMAISGSLDTVGVLTRTVEDAGILLGVLAGHDPRDPSSSQAHVPNYVTALTSGSTHPRIGLVRQFFYEQSKDEVRTNFDHVVRQLVDAGADVTEIECSANFEALLWAHQVVAGAEAAAVHEVNFLERPDDYAPNVRQMLEEGILTTAVDFVRAQEVRSKFRRVMERVVAEFDAVLSPTTAAPAPIDPNGTGDPAFQKPWTNCGFPSISIPSGLSRSGLPLGIQLASAPFAEGLLLATAHWCEGVLGLNLRPPEIVQTVP